MVNLNKPAQWDAADHTVWQVEMHRGYQEGTPSKGSLRKSVLGPAIAVANEGDRMENGPAEADNWLTRRNGNSTPGVRPEEGRQGRGDELHKVDPKSRLKRWQPDRRPGRPLRTQKSHGTTSRCDTRSNRGGGPHRKIPLEEVEVREESAKWRALRSRLRPPPFCEHQQGGARRSTEEPHGKASATRGPS